MGAATHQVQELIQASLMRLLREHSKLRDVHRNLWPAPPKPRGGVRYLTHNLAIRFTWDQFEFLLADKATRLAKSRSKYVKVSNTHKMTWQVQPFYGPTDAINFSTKLAHTVKTPRDAVRILARLDTIVLWLESRGEGLHRAHNVIAEAQAPWQDKLDCRLAIHEMANETQR
jgi:hypothetical protein